MKVAKNEGFIEAKLDKADKKRAKVKELQKKMLGGDEPTINPLDYQLTLVQAMNFYNIYSSDDDKKKWTLESITEKSRKAIWSKIGEFYFKQIGVLIRLRSRDQFLNQSEVLYIEKKSKELDEMIKVYLPVTNRKVVSIQDRVRNIAIDFSAELDGEIDEYIKSGYPKGFVFKNNVKSLSGQAAKVVASFYTNQITELEEVILGKCDQLKESYSHVKSLQLKRFLLLLKSMVAACTEKPPKPKVPAKKGKK